MFVVERKPLDVQNGGLSWATSERRRRLEGRGYLRCDGQSCQLVLGDKVNMLGRQQNVTSRTMEGFQTSLQNIAILQSTQATSPGEIQRLMSALRDDLEQSVQGFRDFTGLPSRDSIT